VLVVNVLTDQIHRVNVQMGQVHRARNVQTEQINHVNVEMEQILHALNVLTAQIHLVDVLIYVMLNFVLFVILILANV